MNIKYVFQLMDNIMKPSDGFLLVGSCRLLLTWSFFQGEIPVPIFANTGQYLQLFPKLTVQIKSIHFRGGQASLLAQPVENPAARGETWV